MSHFTVLVIGENPEEQLAPYHEFESTGHDDQYVQDVDITAQLRKDYETSTTRRIKDQNGTLHDPYENRFYRDPTEMEIKKHGSMLGFGWSNGISYHSKDWGDGKGYRPKVAFVPEGMEEVKIPYCEIFNFRDFIKEWDGKEVVLFGNSPDLEETHKYGYVLLDNKGEVTKVIDRTNPNRKWDWYSLGGRWTGYFKLKHSKLETTRSELLSSVKIDFHVDSCKIGNIDFKGMMEDAGKEAGEKYDKVEILLSGEIPKLKYAWKDLLDNPKFASLDIDDKRNIYNSQYAMKLIQNVRLSSEISKEDNSLLAFLNLEDYQVTREQFVEAARNSSIATFAVIKDGVWYEKGQMGWWGCVSDEKDNWHNEFAKLIQGLSEDTLVSVYDCHI